MGMCFVIGLAAISLSEMLKTLGDWTVTALWVAGGLGFVVFVHELGHFLVAKACGVKCEKFYLGFDIGGWKLAKFQWGETEYGIGALPLGGYVKMLGQDDNPARAAEERERSKATQAEGAGGHALLPTESAAAAESEAPQPLDPRSYMAKSVPQRMAIISAGVIMNLIFAVLMATVAYKLGVKEVTCGASKVLAGEPAWKADIEPGDRFIALGHDPNPRELRYTDLNGVVMFANAETGVDIEVVRDGVKDPFWVNVKPDRKGKRLAPMIGVLSPSSLELISEEPARPGSVADETAKFRGGDTILAVDDTPVSDYRAFSEILARKPNDTLRITVRHKSEKESVQKGSGEQRSDTLGPEEVILVPPQPCLMLGLEMYMGAVVAVQDNSPASKAGIQPGDFFVQIGDESPGDPQTLAERLRRKAGKTISLKIQRDRSGDKSGVVDKSVTLRDPKWYEIAFEGAPLSAPALGVAFQEINRVHAIEAGGPAAGATIEVDGKPATPEHFVPGDEVVSARLILPPDKAALAEYKSFQDPFEFGADKPNWPFFMSVLQVAPAGTKVLLTLSGKRDAEITPEASTKWFNPDRGLRFMPERREFQAQSWGEAFEWGARETKKSTLMVVSFLRAVSGGQISVKGLSGPVGVAEQAAYAAKEGFARFLLFLTMLSANLAVINFLPIPVLDGGHMVFLALEGILRRPVSERVVVAFSYLGLMFILSLMLFVLALDVGLISRFS